MTKGNLNMRAQKVARYNPPRDKDVRIRKWQIYNSGTRALDVCYNKSKTLSLSLGTVNLTSRMRKHLCYDHGKQVKTR